MAQKFTVPVTIKQLSSSGSDAITVYVDADSYARLKIEAGGRLTWGPGSGSGDVNLYRDSADVLKTDDTFKAPALFIDGIEVDTTGATSGQVLAYNGTKFAPATGGGGASVIDDLTDVTITSVVSGDILSYNGSAWVNIPNFAEATKHYVKNDTGGSLTIGSAVYTYGANGTNILVRKAQANAESTSATILGVMAETLAANGIGFVVTQGLVAGFDTSSATAGDPVWLSPSTPGGLAYGTGNKPSAPNHLVYIGVVTRSHAVNGEIFVNISNGWELEELHNVSAASPSSGDFLKYNGTNWVNDAIDLGTDTNGSYVASLVAGTGITLSNNSGEGATPTIAVTSNTYDAYNSSRNVEIKLLMEVM